MSGRLYRSAAAAVLLAALPLAGCSSTGGSAAPSTVDPSATPSSSTTGTIDCAAAQAALGAYQSALSDMAKGIESGDAKRAGTAAEALTAAAASVGDSLPGAPSIVSTFVATSQAAAQRVRDAVEQGTDVATLSKDMELTFNAPLFQQAVPEINRWLALQCPG